MNRRMAVALMLTTLIRVPAWAQDTATPQDDRPAVTTDPRLVGVGSGVGGDDLEIRVGTLDPVEVAAHPAEARTHRMDVGVTEPGRDRPAAELDDARPRPDPWRCLVIGTDGDDPSVTDRRSAGARPGRVHGLEPPAPQDEVGDVRVGSHRERMARRRVGRSA